MRITALRDDIVRVRLPPARLPEDASWAVLARPAHQIRRRAASRRTPASVGFRTAALEVRVERNPLRLVIRDLAGNVISADALGRPTEFSSAASPSRSKCRATSTSSASGDKAGSFDRRDQAYTLWNTDVGPQESADPLYKSIPFFLAIGGGRSYGLFLDNTWRTWFDFGKQARDAYCFRLRRRPA